MLILVSAIAIPDASYSAEDSNICQDIGAHLRKTVPSVTFESGTGTVTIENRATSPSCYISRQEPSQLGDPARNELGKFFAHRNWTRRVRNLNVKTDIVYYTEPKSGRVCAVYNMGNFIPFSLSCETGTNARPTLPVTRLQPTTRSESRPDDPNLIRLPDGRVLPRPATPQAPMTDQPLDWKTKP